MENTQPADASVPATSSDLLERRDLLTLVTSFMVAVSASLVPENGYAQAPLKRNEDGLYTQDWLKPAGADLAAVFAESHENNRQAVILWERKGCPICKALHADILSKPELSSLLTQHFDVYQFNVRGGRTYTIPAYGEISEQDLRSVLYVRGMPTMIFYGSIMDPATGIPIEMGRLEGKFSEMDLRKMIETQ